MTTEFASFNLAGPHPDDLTGEAAENMQYLTKTVAEQPGFQRVRWGTGVEDPKRLHFYVDWDSLADHRKFMAAPVYPGFMEKAATILDLSTASIYHADLSPFPPSAAMEGAPVTEVATAYFPAHYSPEDQEKTGKNIEQLLKAAGRSKACRGFSSGWVEEKVAIPGLEEEGQVYKFMIGWDSIDAHMAFRDTQDFKDNIHLLREAKDVMKLEVLHTSLRAEK